MPSTVRLSEIGNNPQNRISFEDLIQKYRPYFGLLMNKMYNAKPSSSQNPHLTYQPKSLIQYLKPRSAENKRIEKTEKWTIYNSGSKVNQIILTELCPSNTYNEPLTSQQKRVMNFPWKIASPLPEIDNPLTCNCWTHANPELSNFKKYSELDLTNEQLVKYQKEYEKLTRKSN